MMRTLLFLVIAVAAIYGTLRAEDVAQQGDEFAELSEETRAKLDDLIRRLREQSAKIWDLPDSAKLIQVGDELAEFCSTYDLVIILGSDQDQLRCGAYALLLKSHNKKLKAKDIDRLCKYLEVEDRKRKWQGIWAGPILAKNKPLGIPALADILKNTTNRFARVHAAGSLAKRDVKVDAQLKRQAQQALLEALDNPDDSGGRAQSAILSLEPWMVDWLTKAILSADEKSPLWFRGTSVLARREREGYEDVFRSVFLRALENPSGNARTSGVNGLRRLGLKKDDLPLYQRIREDENWTVRRMLYQGLVDKAAPWTAPLFLDGLDDTSGEIVGACAYGLAALRYRAAVPKLVEVLKKLPADPGKPCGPPYRSVGKAIADLTRRGFDFDQHILPVGDGLMRADVIVNRNDVYRREAARLLRWWKETGSKEKW